MAVVRSRHAWPAAVMAPWRPSGCSGVSLAPSPPFAAWPLRGCISCLGSLVREVGSTLQWLLPFTSLGDGQAGLPAWQLGRRRARTLAPPAQLAGEARARVGRPGERSGVLGNDVVERSGSRKSNRKWGAGCCRCGPDMEPLAGGCSCLCSLSFGRLPLELLEDSMLTVRP